MWSTSLSSENKVITSSNTQLYWPLLHWLLCWSSVELTTQSISSEDTSLVTTSGCLLRDGLGWLTITCWKFHSTSVSHTSAESASSARSRSISGPHSCRESSKKIKEELLSKMKYLDLLQLKVKVNNKQKSRLRKKISLSIIKTEAADSILILHTARRPKELRIRIESIQND